MIPHAQEVRWILSCRGQQDKRKDFSFCNHLVGWLQSSFLGAVGRKLIGRGCPRHQQQSSQKNPRLPSDSKNGVSGSLARIATSDSRTPPPEAAIYRTYQTGSIAILKLQCDPVWKKDDFVRTTPLGARLCYDIHRWAAYACCHAQASQRGGRPTSELFYSKTGWLEERCHR